jgi:hypothetical protein
MSYTSTIQVLHVSSEERTAKDGKAYTRRKCEALILNDEGGIEAAGSLPLTPSLFEGLRPGTYRAGFSMGRLEYGDRRGDIVSQLVSLTLVPVRGAPEPLVRATAAPAVPAPAKA